MTLLLWFQYLFLNILNRKRTIRNTMSLFVDILYLLGLTVNTRKLIHSNYWQAVPFEFPPMFLRLLHLSQVFIFNILLSFSDFCAPLNYTLAILHTLSVNTNQWMKLFSESILKFLKWIWVGILSGDHVSHRPVISN